MPYEAYRPEFTTVMDGLSAGLLDGQLLDGIVPLVPAWPSGSPPAARAPTSAAAPGTRSPCSPAFPASHVVGYDIAADAIDRARAEAAAWG